MVTSTLATTPCSPPHAARFSQGTPSWRSSHACVSGYARTCRLKCLHHSEVDQQNCGQKDGGERDAADRLIHRVASGTAGNMDVSLPLNLAEQPEAIAGETVGYARVSSKDQNLERQTELLRKEGVELNYLERSAGGCALEL